MERREELIRRFGLDELISGDLVEALAPLRRGPGELLIRAGDPVRSLYFLVEGRVKAYSTMENGQSVLASFFEPFDVLGEVELFSAERYLLSVEAITPALCLLLPIAAVRKAADRNGRFLMYLCGRLGEKLADRNQAESINLRYPVENRLASYLLASLDGAGELLGTDDLGELADFIGASYRQLARVVRRFRAEGILEGTRGRIRVLDRAKLLPLARDLYHRSGRAGRPGRA
ncbi:MAG TPA: cyclic nucleotide-binding domain-containing protein [Spirochaetales bacterium]|nr:cyclic nucleotide-binding domain-containing protein [Spirochaetales bacterium]HRY55104.1 cyclic nucleotide-binding domain-containing protein [Spirochaetia bacterium]HRZ64647.1 cyclic nucleotide-binding domain-containing protein [Spirochaetia bacterium]